MPDEDRVARHNAASEAHERAAKRHADAAAFWTSRGDERRADLERRNHRIEVDAAALERDRAAVEREHPLDADD